jgi:hypothetical protein
MNPIPAPLHASNIQRFPVERPLIVLGGLALVAGAVSSIAIAIFAVSMATLALPFTAAVGVVGAICVVIGATILLRKKPPEPVEEKKMEQPVPAPAPENPEVNELEKEKARALDYLEGGELSMAALCVRAADEPGYDRELCLKIANQMWIRGDVWNLQKLFNEKLKYSAEERVAFIKQHVDEDKLVKPAKEIVDCLNDHFWNDLRKDLEPVLMGLFEDYVGMHKPEEALLCVSFVESKRYFNRALEMRECEIGKKVLEMYGKVKAKWNQDKVKLADLCMQEKQYSMALEVSSWIVVGEHDNDKDLKSEWLLRVFSAAYADNQNELVEEAFKILMKEIIIGFFDMVYGHVLTDGSIPQFISKWLEANKVELQKLCLNHQYAEARQMIKQAWDARHR